MPDVHYSREDLARIFNALASPDRLAIVEELARAHAAGAAELSITAVAAAAGLDRFAASRHLRVLARAGLVQARRRQAAILHALRTCTLTDVEDWAYAFAVAADRQTREQAHPADAVVVGLADSRGYA